MLDKIPDSIWGTVPQWGVLIVLAIAVVRTSPQWLTTWVTWRLARSNRNRDRIIELEGQVKACRDECDEKIDKLHTEIFGLRTQRNASDAVIMRAILRTSNDPDVRRRLELLEAMEASLTQDTPTIIEGTDNGQS